MTDPARGARPDSSPRGSSPRRRLSPSLRGCLVILVIVTVLPLVGLFGLKAYQDYRASRAASLARTLEVTRGMVQTVEAQLQAYIEGAQVLAQASTLARDDLDGFGKRADAFVNLHSGAVLGLVNPDGMVIRVWEAGKPVQSPQNLHTANNGVAQAMATRQPAVSDFYRGAYTHQPSFSINVPVERDGELIYVLSYNPTAKAMFALTEQQHLPADWIVSIFDSARVSVARIPNPEKFIGHRAADTLNARLQSESEGLFSNVTREGIRVQTAFSHSADFGWSVAIGVPDKDLMAPLWQALFQTAGLAVVALLLSGSAAYVLSGRVLGPVRILLRWVASPETTALPASLGLREADQLARALQVAAAARRAATEELRTLFAISPVGIVRTDRAGQVLEANDAFLRLVGMSLADLDRDGLRVRDLTPREWSSRRAEAAAEVQERGYCDAYEQEFLRHDGARVPVLIAAALLDRHSGHMAGFAVDLSRARAAEAALVASEARLRLSQEAAGLGAWDWNPVTDELHWTSQQYRLLGLDPAASGPPSFDLWYSVVHPQDRPAMDAVREAARGRDTPFRAEFRILLPGTGTERWVQTMGETIRDDSGRPIRILGVNMDVTERRLAENELRRLAETLEERVRQEVAAREETQLQLVQSQRMEALGKLAGGIAHDFNNVLQAISGGLEFIERRAGDTPTVQRFARLCADAVKRGSAITNRLLTFARSGALEAEPIAPRPLLDGLREMLAPLLGVGITMEVDASADLPPLLADRDQLETALVNLSLNARDAMPDGGTLRLAARLDAAPAPLDAPHCIRLEVSDTGFGMNPETLARASEPFYTTKPVGKGTGLGLSMARGFAEQSGGAFAIDSVPGQGTTITLWLPQAGSGGAEAAET